MNRQRMLIDLDRCVGCVSCTVACQELHSTPAWSKRMTVHQVGPFGDFPELAMYFLPVMCQHCQDPPCLEACPTGATKKDENGLVWIDEEECTGCGDCVEVCPFHARFVNPETELAESCDLCSDRELTDGQPFCARSCPAGAIRLYDPDRPDPESARLLESAGENCYSLAGSRQPAGPVIVYLLRRQAWHGWPDPD